MIGLGYGETGELMMNVTLSGVVAGELSVELEEEDEEEEGVVLPDEESLED